MIDIPKQYCQLNWKPVEGYEGGYLVSNSGLVASLHYGKFRILKQSPNEKGYLMVNLTVNYKKSTKKVHLLVANHFIPNPENKPEVNHIDGIKTNNHHTNFEWSTRKENMQHGHKIGLFDNSFDHMKIGVVGREIKGNRVVEFESQKQAGESGFDSTSISRCLRGIRKSHMGFTWHKN